MACYDRFCKERPETEHRCGPPLGALNTIWPLEEWHGKHVTPFYKQQEPLPVPSCHRIYSLKIGQISGKSISNMFQILATMQFNVVHQNWMVLDIFCMQSEKYL